MRGQNPRGYLLVAQRGEIGQGALADVIALAVGLAQQESGAGTAVGNRVDVHGVTSHCIPPKAQTITWLHYARVLARFLRGFHS